MGMQKKLQRAPMRPNLMKSAPSRAGPSVREPAAEACARDFWHSADSAPLPAQMSTPWFIEATARSG